MESIWQTIVDERPNYEWTRSELKRLTRNLREIEPTPKLSPARLREIRRRLKGSGEAPREGDPLGAGYGKAQAKDEGDKLVAETAARKGRDS
jgi:hypothetical protein